MLLLAPLAPAQDARAPLTVIRAGRIHTVSGAVIDHGLILIREGKIVEVRAGGDMPPGAKVIEAQNESVIPGLIDAQAAPLEPGRDADESVAAEVRAIDGYDFYA